MKKTFIGFACSLFSLFFYTSVQAQQQENLSPQTIALRISNYEKDSVASAKNLEKLNAIKSEEAKELAALEKDFLGKRVKDSKDFAQWSVLLDLDKQIINEALEYEKYLDANIINKIVDITGKKVSLETLLTGYKDDFEVYKELIKAYTQHNEIKFQIFREEEVMNILKERLENLRKLLP